jgi:hypothetical protein
MKHALSAGLMLIFSLGWRLHRKIDGFWPARTRRRNVDLR